MIEKAAKHGSREDGNQLKKEGKMKKITFVLLVIAVPVFLVISGGLSPFIAESAETGIKPCQVSIPAIENIFLGKESISLAPYFEISNPNNFPVTLNELRYSIYLKDCLCDGKSLPLNYFIPARGKIMVSSAFAVTWVNLSMWIWQTQGKSMGVAIKEILPTWKGLNGKLFNPKMKKLWAQIPKKHPLFAVNGEIDILGPKGQTTTFDYSTTWSLSERYGIAR